jgi:hypothetical protein
MEKQIIQDAIANILFNKLFEYIEDIEKIGFIRSSKEFKIITELDNFRGENCYSIDYDMVLKIWTNFYSSIQNINKENEIFINRIAEIFSFECDDNFKLIDSLDKYESYITQHLNKEEKKLYACYLIKIRESILEFKKELLRYYAADLTDDFLNNKDIINASNVKYKQIFLQNPTVYIDQNIFSNLIKKADLKKMFLKIAKNNDFSFVYSPYVIEDAANMNVFFIKEYRKFLIELTNCSMVNVENEKSTFVHEEFNDTYSRVKKYSFLRNTYERKRYINILTHYYNFPILRKESKFNKLVSKDIIGFFKNKENKENKEFKLIESRFGDSRIINFIHTGELNLSDKDNNIPDIINDLLELFDYINFNTEDIKISNIKKVYSSYRDNCHITYAYKCNYFLTNDKKLRTRAEIIYKLIGSKTKIMSFEDFQEHIKNDYLDLSNY